ncbi:MAG TPA: ABC transporter permease [Rhizomicrobium sp.]|nr:ABC transporter permease [Rhizomicrobium sp.]
MPLFWNYLTVALRNIARHKLYSFINLFGLALGLTCVVFIILFVRDELSFDKWVPDSGNLYRVDVDAKVPDRPVDRFALAPFVLGDFMKDHLPEVTGMTRDWGIFMTVQIGDRQFLDSIDEVDPSFFNVMKLPLVAGDPGQVLAHPESIVLSEKLARKYFGTTNVVGRQVAINRANCGKEQVTCPAAMAILRVTGVMRDLPHNTQLTIDAVIPHTSPVDRIGDKGKKAWFSFNGFVYVRLAPGSDPVQVVAKLDRAMDKLLNFSSNLGLRQPASKSIHVVPVLFREVHMNTSDTIGNEVPPGSWATVYGLGAIGLVILLAACFNFTNLATARAMRQAREIGLRKCVGASRNQVAAQFLGEAVVMALVALVFAFALVEILLPSYDAFLARPITLNYLADWPLLLIITAIAELAGLLSGIYPALILSGFRPATALRSNQSGQAGSGGLRTVLVVLQFAVSIALAVATLVVFAQIDFARTQELGFRHDNTVVIQTGRRMPPETRESLINTLRTYPGISGVGASSDTPFSSNVNIESIRIPGRPDSVTAEELLITPQFLELYGMKLAAGRALSDSRAEDSVITRPDYKNDGHNLLINETAARYFGFGAQGAVGKTIQVDKDNMHIVGVLKDIRFKGVRRAVQPTLYLNDKLDSGTLSVRLTGQDIPGALAFIDRTWHRMSPSTAISRSFLDDSFAKLYEADRRQGMMFGIFVGVAILIAALGLFGLAAFTVGRRTREIGIRKVFGARTRDVAVLLLWQFSIPVLVANLIAWPLAWYYLRGWLQGFASHITLSPVYFAAAGMGALVIAWVTVLSHALRVARANPIHALRTE